MNSAFPQTALEPQSYRRKTVIAYALALALILVSGALRSYGASPSYRNSFLEFAYVFPMLLAVALGIYAFAGLGPRGMALPRMTAHGSADHLDEREKGRLMQAQLTAQRIYAGLAALTMLTYVFTGDGFIRFPAWSFAVFTIGLVTYLPTAILAWTEPDLED